MKCHVICEGGECICKSNNPYTNREICCVVEDTPDVSCNPKHKPL